MVERLDGVAVVYRAAFESVKVVVVFDYADDFFFVAFFRIVVSVCGVDVLVAEEESAEKRQLKGYSDCIVERL